jgi:protocatechuate 3,4-dioxygenase beta subunit
MPAPAAQSIDPKKLCKIEGRTVNATTGEPVPRVGLTLTGSGLNAGTRGARSDNDGRFLIEGIPPGTYRLVADRVGFLRQGYGSRTPGGSGAPLNLSEGQHLKDLEFRLVPQGVIMGQIFDEEGDPLPRASVMAYRQGSPGSAQPGQPGAMRGGGGQSGQQSSAGSAMSNDIGEYRIAGLSPGRYVVVASSPGGAPGRGAQGRGGSMEAGQTGASDQARVPTYYPSVTDPSAALPVDLAAGQEVAGINIGIRRGSLFRIQGKLMGANPQDVSGVMLTLMTRGAGAVPFMARGGAQVKPDGSFEMSRVQPGAYYLIAQRMGRGGGGGPGGGIVGKTMVDVTSSDITGLLVPLTEPLTVSGTVKVEGQQSAGIQRLSLTLTSADGTPSGSPGGRVAATGAFSIVSVFPDRYYLNVSGLPEGAYVKSVKLANQEVADKGIDLTNFRTAAALDVVLSPNGATLEGAVTADDKPATGSYVAVLADPLRPEQPYLNKFATADQDGKFTIRGLAPGSYRVYAWEEPQAELSRDPGLAKPYEQKAVKVKLEEGATERIELKVLRAEDARL